MQRRLVVDGRDLFVGHDERIAQAHRTEREHVTDDMDVERGEELAGKCTGGDACGRLSGTGALEDVTHVAAVVLQRAGEIGMSRTRACYRGAPGACRLGRRLRRHVHGLLPVLPVAIADQHGHGTAERVALAHTAQDLRRVHLDLHAAAAAVAELPTTKVAGEGVLIDGKTGREAFHRRHQRLSV